MANILSQEEVDALLNAVEQGEILSEDDSDVTDATGDRVVEYNFRRPNLITKDQLRGLTNVHEDFARELQSSLSITLRNAVDISLVSAEQQQYNEFVLSLSDITHMVLLGVRPLLGRAVMEINLSLVFGIVDLLLGGEGDVETSVRKLTDVEVAILEPITHIVFVRLEEALRNIMEVSIEPERHECSPEYVQAAPPDAPVVILTFDAKVGLANGIINICYPLPMVQSLIREIQGRTGQIDNYYGRADVADAQQRILSSIMDVPVATSVDLGQAVISTRDWLSLASGDVVVLDREVGSTLILQVERMAAFNGVPGRRRKNLALKLVGRVTPGDS